MGQRADATLPATISQTRLVTSTGKPFDLADLRGKVVVVSDMMTLCQETCPLDTANVVAAARAAEQDGDGQRVQFVSVTIDPGRDTVSRLAAYRDLYRPAPADWTVATGSKATLARFWHTLGVYIHRVRDTAPVPRDWLTHRPLTYDLTHSDEVFFLGTNGNERFLLEGAPHVARGAPIPDRIRSFMDAAGRRNITHPDRLAWTLPQELDVLSWLLNKRIS